METLEPDRGDGVRHLRVATWNLHLGRDRDGRPFDQVAAIDQLAAEVVLVQERWRPDHGDDPLQTLGSTMHELTVARATPTETDVCIARRDDAGTGSWSIGVITPYPVTARRAIDLGRIPTDPAARRALHLVLDLGDRSLDVVVTHLSHRVPMGAWQLARLGRRIDTTRPTLLGGDLNQWGVLVGLALPRWDRTAAGPTYPAYRPRHGIDHLAVTGGVRVVDAAVATLPGSDHLPVVATVAVPPAGG